jgi:hypothetical protein
MCLALLLVLFCWTRPFSGCGKHGDMLAEVSHSALLST